MATYRETVDYGIDLGTTNSAIARAEGADAEVIRNNRQREYTPSAVYVTPSGTVQVGDAARDRAGVEPDNACAEFKLRMGTRGEHQRFKASGRSMTPEELSAEVLKSLRANVSSQGDDEVEAAVITIPAAFELDQCDATGRAAALAGLRFAPLLQEPTAAAWAYSVDNAPRKAFWLVYDFGGGTFDAAVVKVHDGEFTVVNHAGDNFLGGKRADWALVDEVLAPKVRGEFGRIELDREDPRGRINAARLKTAAEYAKIELSRASSAAVYAELRLPDGSGADFNYELTRDDVDRVTRPLVETSIELCRKALDESRTRAADIERVVLVGGMTQVPVLREMLAHPVEGLGIPLDHSLDPVTVVARGAAIFAGTQRIPKAARAARPAEVGQVRLDLEFAAVGQDVDPLVGGRARADLERDWSGWTIEFDDTGSEESWTSGKVPLRPDGGFSTRLFAQERTRTEFAITLRDHRGAAVPTDTPSLAYRHADLVGSAPTLSHSIRVGYADNTTGVILAKGTELPASKTLVAFTTVAVDRSAGTGLILVPLGSGERPRADRNTVIGSLELHPAEVRRNVPAGSEVEVSVRVDTSFAASAVAYVPVLDEEFDIDIDLSRSTAPGLPELRADRAELERRYDELRDDVSDVDAPEARNLLHRFESQDALSEIDRLLRQAEVDPDATATCQVRLRDAHTVLDEAEEHLELPRAVDDAEATRKAVREIVKEAGQAEHRTGLRRAEAELDAAIADRDLVLVRRQTEELRHLAVRLLDETGRLPVVVFSSLEHELADHPSREVQRHLAEGRRRLNDGDVHHLAAVNAKLRPYLPDDGAGLGLDGGGSTVRAGDRR
ncbi:Hsp70 family protein [Glycomyces sp. NPDC047369]